MNLLQQLKKSADCKKASPYSQQIFAPFVLKKFFQGMRHTSTHAPPTHTHTHLPSAQRKSDSRWLLSSECNMQRSPSGVLDRPIGFGILTQLRKRNRETRNPESRVFQHERTTDRRRTFTVRHEFIKSPGFLSILFLFTHSSTERRAESLGNNKIGFLHECISVFA